MFNSCATAQIDSQRTAESELSNWPFRNAIFSWPSDFRWCSAISAALRWSSVIFVTSETYLWPATATVGRAGFSGIEVSTVMNPSTPREIKRSEYVCNNFLSWRCATVRKKKSRSLKNSSMPPTTTEPYASPISCRITPIVKVLCTRKLLASMLGRYFNSRAAAKILWRVVSGMERDAGELFSTAETVPGVRPTCFATSFSVTAPFSFNGFSRFNFFTAHPETFRRERDGQPTGVF